MIEAVEIVAPDGAVLRGQLRGAGADWAVLVHDLDEDLDAWQPLPSALAERRLSVLALDLRGHGGSEGERELNQIVSDVLAAIDFARATGAERIFLGAAGAATGPVAEAAGRAGADGLFAIAPAAGPGTTSSTIPQLVVCASRDRLQEAAASELRRGNTRSVVVSVPTPEAGLGLLRGPWGTNVESYIVSFLSSQRLAPHRSVIGRHA